jgi:hypothetical protein
LIRSHFVDFTAAKVSILLAKIASFAFAMEPILRPDPNVFEPWMAWVFIVLIAALAYVRVVYARRFRLLWRTVVRLQILRQIMREELLFSHRASLILFANFVLSSGLIVYTAGTHYGWLGEDTSGFVAFGLISIGVLGLYLLKFLFMSILGWLFDDSGLLREYRFEIFSINKALGLVYLPLALVVVTAQAGKLPTFIILAGVLWLISFAFRILQGLAISFSYPVSRVYIILYLCTLEILPFVLLLSLFEKELA